MKKLLIVALALLALSGCGPKTMYTWNGYDQCLYDYYKDPAAGREEFVKKLQEILQEGETEEGKVPPGVYAEYGFALYELNKVDEAATFFRKEQQKWPESAPFMEKMIANLANPKTTGGAK